MKYKKAVCMGLIALLMSGNMSVHAAAAAEKEKINSESFKERVQHILDEYYMKSAPPVSKEADANSEEKADEGEHEQLPAQPMQQTQPKTVAPLYQAEARYNFDWKGTPLSQSLYAVAKISGKGVVINGELSGTVYTSLRNVTAYQALDYLSRAFGFNWMLEEDNIIISTAGLMKQSEIFKISYANKDRIKEELKALGIDEDNIYANNESGTVSVTGTPYQLKEAQKRINAVDKEVSQCLLVAQMIEINHGKNLDLGFKYSLPTYSHAGTDDSTSKNLPGNVWEKLTFSASASAGKELSKGRVIARPMIMMLNGQEGKMSFGDKVPVLTTTSTTSSTQVTVEYKDVGTNLTVTPIINPETNEISLNVDTEVSSISKWVTSGETTAPQISSRAATTSAHLKSGQSFVIGGLMSINELNNLSGIPGIMNLPILGKLFAYHSTSRTYGEVYIMITPYIVTDEINPRDLLKKVERIDN